MNDTIAKRDASARRLDAPNISKRARVLAGAVLRLHRHAVRHDQGATPAELAIAEGVLTEVSEADDGEVALEHYSAQTARGPTDDEWERMAEGWRQRTVYDVLTKDGAATHATGVDEQTAASWMAHYGPIELGDARLALAASVAGDIVSCGRVRVRARRLAVGSRSC